jgi:hypothetical protein
MHLWLRSNPWLQLGQLVPWLQSSRPGRLLRWVQALLNRHLPGPLPLLGLLDRQSPADPWRLHRLAAR